MKSKEQLLKEWIAHYVRPALYRASFHHAQCQWYLTEGQKECNCPNHLVQLAIENMPVYENEAL